MTEYTQQDWIQLYQLLDRMPEEGLAQSERNALSSVWEIVRGQLMALDLDPDDVVEGVELGTLETRARAWQNVAEHLHGRLSIATKKGVRSPGSIFALFERALRNAELE